MQSGKDLDAMEHGADMKGVQPSEPSRGTGMLNYAAYVSISTLLCACMHAVCAVGLHPTAHCAALPALKPVACIHPGTMDRKGNYFVPDSKRFNDQLPNSADQSAKW